MFKQMKKASAKVGAFLGLLLAFPSWATSTTPSGLPAISPPSTGNTTNYIDLIQGYALDAFVVMGLIIGTVAFIMVSKNVVKVYGEIGDGKAEWGDMGAQLVGGVLLLVFVVFMLIQAQSVLA